MLQITIIFSVLLLISAGGPFLGNDVIPEPEGTGNGGFSGGFQGLNSFQGNSYGNGFFGGNNGGYGQISSNGGSYGQSFNPPSPGSNYGQVGNPSNPVGYGQVGSPLSTESSYSQPSSSPTLGGSYGQVNNPANNGGSYGQSGAQYNGYGNNFMGGYVQMGLLPSNLGSSIMSGIKNKIGLFRNYNNIDNNNNGGYGNNQVIPSKPSNIIDYNLERLSGLQNSNTGGTNYPNAQQMGDNKYQGGFKYGQSNIPQTNNGYNSVNMNNIINNRNYNNQPNNPSTNSRNKGRNYGKRPQNQPQNPYTFEDQNIQYNKIVSHNAMPPTEKSIYQIKPVQEKQNIKNNNRNNSYKQPTQITYPTTKTPYKINENHYPKKMDIYPKINNNYQKYETPKVDNTYKNEDHYPKKANVNTNINNNYKKQETPKVEKINNNYKKQEAPKVVNTYNKNIKYVNTPLSTMSPEDCNSCSDNEESTSQESSENQTPQRSNNIEYSKNVKSFDVTAKPFPSINYIAPRVPINSGYNYGDNTNINDNEYSDNANTVSKHQRNNDNYNDNYGEWSVDAGTNKKPNSINMKSNNNYNQDDTQATTEEEIKISTEEERQEESEYGTKGETYAKTGEMAETFQNEQDTVYSGRNTEEQQNVQEFESNNDKEGHSDETSSYRYDPQQTESYGQSSGTSNYQQAPSPNNKKEYQNNVHREIKKIDKNIQPMGSYGSNTQNTKEDGYKKVYNKETTPAYSSEYSSTSLSDEEETSQDNIDLENNHYTTRKYRYNKQNIPSKTYSQFASPNNYKGLDQTYNSKTQGTETLMTNYNNENEEPNNEKKDEIEQNGDNENNNKQLNSYSKNNYNDQTSNQYQTKKINTAPSQMTKNSYNVPQNKQYDYTKGNQQNNEESIQEKNYNFKSKDNQYIYDDYVTEGYDNQPKITQQPNYKQKPSNDYVYADEDSLYPEQIVDQYTNQYDQTSEYTNEQEENTQNPDETGGYGVGNFESKTQVSTLEKNGHKQTYSTKSLPRY